MAWIAAERCGTCKYSFKAEKTLVCRRHPPHPTLIMAMTQQGPAPTGCIANFPPIQDTQWCGEYVRGLSAKAGETEMGVAAA